MTAQDAMKLVVESAVEDFGFLAVIDALRDVCTFNQDEAQDKGNARLALLWLNRDDALRRAEQAGG